MECDLPKDQVFYLLKQEKMHSLPKKKKDGWRLRSLLHCATWQFGNCFTPFICGLCWGVFKRVHSCLFNMLFVLAAPLATLNQPCLSNDACTTGMQCVSNQFGLRVCKPENFEMSPVGGHCNNVNLGCTLGHTCKNSKNKDVTKYYGICVKPETQVVGKNKICDVDGSKRACDIGFQCYPNKDGTSLAGQGVCYLLD
ncbi:hypothetical protein EDD86DRAFT_198437 [Gorgonomyces haynaldii]|nr:hypothetical protein EDD86DRAFT_198437 [Gorgonomyces haynaldii]